MAKAIVSPLLERGEYNPENVLGIVGKSSSIEPAMNDLPKEVKGIALRPQEYYDYVQFSLQTPDEDFEGFTFARYLEAYMGTSEYKAMTNNDKVQKIQNLKIEAMENGLELLIEKYPEIGIAITDRKDFLDLDILQKPGVNVLQWQ